MGSFVQAVQTLLGALGRTADETADGPAALEQILRGQGLAARLVRIDDGRLPEGDMVGALLEVEDDVWLPLVAGPLGLERVGGGLVAEGIAHLGRAVVLTTRVESLRQFLPFLRRHKGRLLEIMAGGLIVNLLALLFPLFSSFVYDKVLGNGVTETLWALAIGLVLAIGLDYAVRAVRALMMERLAVTAEADIDHALFRNLMAGNVARLPSVGRVLDKYKQVLASRDFVSTSYMLSALDVPFLALFLVVVGVIAGPLVLVPLAVGAVTIALHLLLVIPVHDYEGQARRAGEQRFALLADTLSAREVIVGGRLRDELARRWRKASTRAGLASGRARYWHVLASSLSVGASNLAYVSTIVCGALMIENRALTAGGLLAATMLTGRAMAALSSVVLLATRYREFRAAMTEMDALLPGPAEEAEDAPARGALPPRLRLVGVGCRLRSEAPPTLSGINLRIEPGEIVGIAGHPGAGKSTLMRMLAGVLAPAEGQVLIDALPVERLAPADISATIGYKPQDPCLFEGTVEDNIRAGNHAAGHDDMERALAASGLIHAFERGELTLATEVGPRGANLSGGQRQMVALARALLGAPPVLLLDEPNTGLDAPLERALADHLAALREGRAMVISSHSRTLLSVCTRIIVIDGGRIITDGPRERVLGN